MDKLPAPTEKEITKAIRDYLRLKNIWHFKVMQGLGCAVGIPDIVGIYRGRFLGIEIKTKTGKLSIMQKVVIDEINANCGIAFVARSVDDVIQKLREVG